jgi:hypothetical protein
MSRKGLKEAGERLEAERDREPSRDLSQLRALVEQYEAGVVEGKREGSRSRET